jgi:hypothetical protein
MSISMAFYILIAIRNAHDITDADTTRRSHPLLQPPRNVRKTLSRIPLVRKLLE